MRRMTRLSGFAAVGVARAACTAGGGGLAAAAGSAAEAGAASPPDEDGEPAEPGARLRRRRLEPLARSEDDAGAPALGEAGAAGAAMVSPFPPVDSLVLAALRRRLRLRGAGLPCAVTGSDARSTAAAGRRNTLAPTSPSATTAPSEV